MKDLNLQIFEAKDFMGISQDNPILIDFSKSRGNAVKLSGDQGTRKTSTISALMYIMGATFNVDTKNFFNQKDEAINVELKFKYEGDDYVVTANGARFQLKRKFKDRWVPESEPKNMMRKMFGNLGVSPMFLKDLRGKDQIKWIKETFGVEEEASKKEVKLTNGLKEAEVNRRDVNREIKTLKGALDAEPLYADYENSLKKFKDAPNVKKEKERYDKLAEDILKYDRAKNEVSRLTIDLQTRKDIVKEHERQLEMAKQQVADTETRLATGKKWIDENKSVKKDYDEASAAWMNLSKTLAEYDRWKTILKREEEYTERLDAVNIVNDQIDKMRKDLLKLTKTYLPDVPGLEIRVKTGIDDEDEGIYYNNKSLAMLSESELWDLFVDHIWPAKDVFFIFCDNLSSLGSEALKNMNRLLKEKKAMIFASEMDRSKDEINITVTSKLS